MSNYKFETLQLHVGQEQPDPATDARAVPIYQTTSYVFHNSAHAAARFGLADARQHLRPPDQLHPGRVGKAHRRAGGRRGCAGHRLRRRRHHLRHPGPGPGWRITSWPRRPSTAAAITCWPTPCPQFGVTTTFVDAHDLAEVENAIQDNTKAIYLETLGNPNSDIPDIDAIAAIAHKHGLPLVIDNTFGTPYLIRPIEHGADIVVHSATKFIGGHGTTLGGVIVDSGKFDWKASGKYARHRRPQPQLPRRVLRGRRRPRRLRHLHPGHPAAGHRRDASLPSTPSCCSRAWRPCPCGWTATRRTPRRWWSSWRTTPRWSR